MGKLTHHATSMTQIMATEKYPPKRWRKLPVVIEAIQFDGTYESALAIEAWGAHIRWIDRVYQNKTFEIETHEGWITASEGNYIIKGVGERILPM